MQVDFKPKCKLNSKFGEKKVFFSNYYYFTSYDSVGNPY